MKIIDKELLDKVSAEASEPGREVSSVGYCLPLSRMGQTSELDGSHCSIPKGTVPFGSVFC